MKESEGAKTSRGKRQKRVGKGIVRPEQDVPCSCSATAWQIGRDIDLRPPWSTRAVNRETKLHLFQRVGGVCTVSKEQHRAGAA